ncbi:hypothetical protein [Microbispora sp. H10836]|uniref:hypothetical protein n=1 Tax=Microbispora sp. H10836 TaxID=2729106 RepID=UPI001B8C458F|nr:hypothetical protein [Microbispora sp. H10836]
MRVRSRRAQRVTAVSRSRRDNFSGLRTLAPGAPAPGTPTPEIAGPRTQTMAEAARLLGARRGVKVVGVDGSGMPDAEIAADGAFLPGPHAKLAGPAFQEWLGTQA